jgi:hypothetical protein
VSDRRLIILDSVVAARHLLRSNALLDQDELLSTHYSVVEFLGVNGKRCRDVSDFVDAPQVALVLSAASSELDNALLALDRSLAPQICLELDLPSMAIFHSAFKYLGQYQLAGRRLFERVLSERLSEAAFAAVMFHYVLPNAEDRSFSFVRAAEYLCLSRRIPFSAIRIEADVHSRPGPRGRWMSLARRAYKSPRSALVAILRKLHGFSMRFELLSSHTPAAMVFTGGSKSFFSAPLRRMGMRIIDVAPLVRLALRSRDAGLDEKLSRVAKAIARWQESHASTSELERHLVDALLAKARQLLRPLPYVNAVVKRRDVRLVAWDLPVVTDPTHNLIVELGLALQLPVFGRQHGANYGCQNLGTIHFDSDFNRCTQFFSYAFGLGEFSATYPAGKVRCGFVPAGHTLPSPRTSARTLDIVFPIANCMPLYYLTRLPESELVRRQVLVIEAMESRKSLRCVLKAAPNSNAANFAHIERARRLKNVQFETTPWSSFLEQYRPRLAVFEVVSTPLFEAIELDVDMFVMLDPLFPFSPQALQMLRKRAHVFDSPEAMAAAICAYDPAASPRLRNDEFARTFVNRGSRESAFAKLNETGAWRHESGVLRGLPQ